MLDRATSVVNPLCRGSGTDGDEAILDGDGEAEVRALAPTARPRHLFVAAGGGGDVLATLILQRKLCGDGGQPYVVTYSWDRLMVDPVPGPRDPSWFIGIDRFGDHNYVVSAQSRVRSPGSSLLPRLARELGTKFFLLDPTGAARGMRLQLAELVRELSIQRVSLVDSGGDILACGDEPELRSPMADCLTLAAADDIGAPVDVLVTGAGLDGELSHSRVCEIVTELGGCASGQFTKDDVKWCMPILDWHPSEVNGLLIAAAIGYEGTVEIRDAAFEVHVDQSAAVIHHCHYDAAITHNVLAKAMTVSDDLRDAEGAMLDHQHHSEIDYQRNKARQYNRRHHVGSGGYDQRIQTLLRYGMSRRDHVDALSLRRAAEIMQITSDELETLGPKLGARCPQSYQPPLWMLNPPADLSIFAR